MPDPGRRIYRQRKRADQVDQTRAQILQAARARLLADGAHGLVLQDVADDAGVSKPTIFNQFGSKLGLLEAVAIELFPLENLMLHGAREIPDPTQACREFVRLWCRFWDVDPDLFRHISRLSVVDPEVRLATDQRRYDVWQEIVERLAAEDRLQQGFNVAEATVAIGAITSFAFHDELVTNLGIDPNAVADMVLRLLERIVRLED